MISIAEVDAPRACAQCGTELHAAGRFCHRCGAPAALPMQRGPRAQAVEERRLVTALFVDLTGSTTLGERLDAEQLREVMQDYYTAMREEIEAEGGTVSVFVGDAVMAVFGVPVAHEDDASRALRAGLRLHHRIERLNQDLGHLDGVRLGVRVGIHTGEILAGQHLTDADPRLGQLTGDALNVAARLETAAQPGQVVASERTARAARGFVLSQLGPLSLKGKSEPVVAFAVEGLAEEEVGDLGDGRRPMVGRAAELRLLRAALRRVSVSGQPELVTVVGEAGVGKSRLVRELVSAARREGVDVLRGRCLPPGQAITYWPLAEIVRQRAAVQIDDAASIARDKIVASCDDLLAGEPTADPVRVAAAICFTIGIEGGDAFAHMDARQVRQEMHDAWRWFFTTLGRRNATVVKIEDLHNAGSALIELIEDVVAHSAGAVLWICSARSEIHRRFPAWARGRERHRLVDLQPLSTDDSLEVIHGLLGREDLPTDLCRRMTARADGNPFFLEEIVRTLVDEQRILRRDGVWRLVGGAAETSIPDTVQMALAARIDLLGANDRRVLQLASVLGRDFWPGPVAHLLETPVSEVEEALARLEDREFVVYSDGGSVHGETDYAFKHMMTRDVAYRGIPRKQRTRAHIGIADWVAERFAQMRPEMAEILAYHYGTAYAAVSEDRREPPQAVETLRQKTFEATVGAAEATAARWAVENAARLSADAVRLARFPFEEARSREVLGRARLMALDGHGAWDAWTRAADLRVEHIPEDGQSIARICGVALESVTRWTGSLQRPVPEPDARRYLELGMRRANGYVVERVRLLSAAAWWPQTFPQAASSRAALVKAAAAGEEAVTLAEQAGRHDLASAALDGVCNIHTVQGHYGAAMEVINRRLQKIPFLADAEEVSDILVMAAIAAYSVGEYSAAWEYASRCLDSSGEMTLFTLQSHAWRGMANFRRGLWRELMGDLDATRQVMGASWDDPPHAGSTHLIAAALVLDIQGSGGEADELMERCHWGMVEGAGRPSVIKAPLVAQLLLRRGRVAEAREVVEHPDWHTNRTGAPLLFEARCELLAAEGAWGDVERLARSATRFSRVAGLKALPAYVDRMRGRAAMARGDAAAAFRLLARARRRFEHLEARWESACTRLELGSALVALDRCADARKVLGTAVAALEDMGSARELRRGRELLELTGR